MLPSVIKRFLSGERGYGSSKLALYLERTNECNAQLLSPNACPTILASVSRRDPVIYGNIAIVMVNTNSAVH
jgi:hypothetical protein